MIFFKKKSKDFCFIHIPKTAGTSFQNTIFKDGIANNKYNLIFEKLMKKNNCKYDHVPFYFVNNFFHSNFNSKKKIEYVTIVRNPWDRFASLFEQELLRNKVGFSKKHALNKDLRNNFNSNYEIITENLLKNLDFFNLKKRKELFKFWLFYLGVNRKILPNLNPNFNVLSQSWWFIDDLEDKIIKNIFLFENLDSLEAEYSIKLSHENAKKIKFEYSDYYDQQSIDYIYKLDQFVINKFKYDF